MESPGRGLKKAYADGTIAVEKDPLSICAGWPAACPHRACTPSATRACWHRRARGGRASRRRRSPKPPPRATSPVGRISPTDTAHGGAAGAYLRPGRARLSHQPWADEAARAGPRTPQASHAPSPRRPRRPGCRGPLVFWSRLACWILIPSVVGGWRSSSRATSAPAARPAAPSRAPAPGRHRLCSEITFELPRACERFSTSRAPAARNFPTGAKSVLGGMGFFAHHGAYHIGQVALIRKSLGLGGLVG